MIALLDEKKLRRLMRRIAVEGPVRDLPRAAPGDGLLQPSAVLESLYDRLRRRLHALPLALLPEETRGLLAGVAAGSGALLSRIAAGLEFLGAPVAGVEAQTLRQLGRRARSAGKLWRLAALLKNDCMDARLLLGAFGWFLIDQAALCLEEEFAGPLGNEERDALLRAFTPFLLELDRVLRHSAERRRELAGVRAKLAADAREAQQAAAAELTVLELLHGPERPSRDALIAAARHYMGKKGKK